MHPDDRTGAPAPILPLPTATNVPEAPPPNLAAATDFPPPPWEPTPVANGTASNGADLSDLAAELATPPAAAPDTLVVAEVTTLPPPLTIDPVPMPTRTADPVTAALADALAAVESMVAPTLDEASAPPRDEVAAPSRDGVPAPFVLNGAAAPVDIAAPTAPPDVAVPAAPEAPVAPAPAPGRRTAAAVVLDGPGHPVHSARRRRRSASLLPPLPSPADIPEDAAGRVAIITVSAPPDVVPSFTPTPAGFAPRALAAGAASDPASTRLPEAGAAERSLITAITAAGPLEGWIPVFALGVALVVIFVVGVLVTR